MTPRATRNTPPARRLTPRSWAVDFRRALRRHRRKLAILATLAAVLAGLTALAPPRPDTVSVVTAEHALTGGTTVRAEDLDTTELPPRAVPDGAWTDPSEVVGQTLAGPVPAGQVLTAGSAAAPPGERQRLGGGPASAGRRSRLGAARGG